MPEHQTEIKASVWSKLSFALAVIVLLVAAAGIAHFISQSGRNMERNAENIVSTQAAAEPISVNDISLKALNIFLSNFSEVYITSLHPKTADGYSLLNYVTLHCLINFPSQITVVTEKDTSDFCIAQDTVDSCLSRFFDITLEPQSYTSEDAPDHPYEYRDGAYWCPAISDGVYNRFSAVSEVLAQEDGTSLVYFDIYELDLDAYVASGMPDGLYSYSAKTIQDSGYDVAFIGSGKAVVSGDLHEKDSLNWHLLDLSEN